MIRRLRSRHRGMALLLAVVVAPLFVAGLLARKVDERPSVRRGDDHLVEIEWDRWNEAWTGAALGSHLAWGPPDRSAPGDRALYWVIAERRPLIVADPLVYHVGGQVEIGDPLPPGAMLLGPFRTGEVFTAFAPPATRLGGTLLIYSLAQGEVRATHEVTP